MKLKVLFLITISIFCNSYYAVSQQDSILVIYGDTACTIVFPTGRNLIVKDKLVVLSPMNTKVAIYSHKHKICTDEELLIYDTTGSYEKHSVKPLGMVKLSDQGSFTIYGRTWEDSMLEKKMFSVYVYDENGQVIYFEDNTYSMRIELCYPPYCNNLLVIGELYCGYKFNSKLVIKEVDYHKNVSTLGTIDEWIITDPIPTVSKVTSDSVYIKVVRYSNLDPKQEVLKLNH